MFWSTCRVTTPYGRGVGTIISFNNQLWCKWYFRFNLRQNFKVDVSRCWDDGFVMNKLVVWPSPLQFGRDLLERLLIAISSHTAIIAFVLIWTAAAHLFSERSCFDFDPLRSSAAALITNEDRGGGRCRGQDSVWALASNQDHGPPTAVPPHRCNFLLASDLLVAWSQLSFEWHVHSQGCASNK